MYGLHERDSSSSISFGRDPCCCLSWVRPCSGISHHHYCSSKGSFNCLYSAWSVLRPKNCCATWPQGKRRISHLYKCLDAEKSVQSVRTKVLLCPQRREEWIKNQGFGCLEVQSWDTLVWQERVVQGGNRGLANTDIYANYNPSCVLCKTYLLRSHS